MLGSGRAALALVGLNLWAIALVAPTVATGQASLAPLLLPAPALLAAGVARASEAALLLGVPVAALLPLGMPELETARQSPGAFVLIAAALAAYLWRALAWLHRRETAPAEARVRTVEGPPPAPRWQRRRRVYAGLVAASVAVPALLLYAVDVHPATAASLAAGHAHPESAQAVLTAVAALVAAMAFRGSLVAPLTDHLDEDGPTRDALRRLALRRPRWTRLWLLVAAGAGLGGALLAREML